MAATVGKSVLKGPGVQARPLLVRAALEDSVPDATGAATMPPDPAATALGSAVLKQAQAQAERLLAQAQVELGRAQAEAEQLREAAEARLAEAGEIITSAAEARRLLEEAKQQAAALIAEAEAQVEALQTSACEQGLEEGRLAGREEGARLAQEEVAHELELVHTMAAELLEARHDLMADAEPAIIRLALDVARTVIAREIEADPDILKGTLTRAMLKAAGEERLRLRLHPDDVARIGDYLDNLAARFAARGVEVLPDPLVGPAGIIVETRSGTVDARVETQLDKIERAMLAVVGE
jgi:flagellar assembly protein FliH